MAKLEGKLLNIGGLQLPYSRYFYKILFAYVFTNSDWLTTYSIFEPMIFTVKPRLQYKKIECKLWYFVGAMKNQIEVVLLGSE